MRKEQHKKKRRRRRKKKKRKKKEGRGKRKRRRGRERCRGWEKRRLGHIIPEINSWKLGKQNATVSHLTLEVFLFNFDLFNCHQR